MENDFRTALKRFWSTIRRLRGGKRLIVNTVYGGDGALLTSTRDVVSRWGEYFEDLLNPTDTCSEEAQSESTETGPPISGAEVAEVVKKLLGGKAPGVDEVRCGRCSCLLYNIKYKLVSARDISSTENNRDQLEHENIKNCCDPQKCFTFLFLLLHSTGVFN